MVTGIFAGSFDPPTYGHMNIIKRAMTFCDKLIVTIAVNPSKKYMFTEEERVDLLQKFIRQEVNFLNSTDIRVKVYHGLIVEQAKEEGAKLLIRGCHGAADYAGEENLANINRAISGIDTVILPTPSELSTVSSSATKELAKHGIYMKNFIPDFVADAVSKKFGFIKESA